MIPAILAAQFTKPLIKWGAIAGGIVILLLSVWAHGCSTGKQIVKQQWDATLAQQAANAVHEAVKADAMEAQVVKANDQAERIIEAKVEQVKKKVVQYAKQDPKPLRAATVALYGELISVPNEAGLRVPAADPGAGAPEIPRGGLAPETAAGIPDEDGHTVDLTTEELAQAAVDFAEKYALLKNAYKGLSDWNDGRERLELERLQAE